MNYSYNILNRHVNLPITELSDLLVSLGHEVEGYDTFINEHLVVGKIESITKHPNSDKLNICQVNIGDEQNLQIVCGAPNASDNEYVIVAKVGANLGDLEIKESTIRDVLSQGMLCSLTELGFDSKFFTEEDAAGIYLFTKQVELGSSALLALDLEDYILDVSLTANRGDVLSYDGVLRDLYAGLGKSFVPTFTTHEGSFLNTSKALINEGAYSFHTLELKVKDLVESPIELKSFLIKHNIKPQNIIVDCANYAMINSGIPMHTYDSDELSGDLLVTKLDDKSKFIGLDGHEYTLNENTLVIKDQEKIVSVASVMGSDSSKITDKTRNVTVEIGNFISSDVRFSGNNFNGKTDALLRGEKGIDHNAILRAFNYFIDCLNQTELDFSFSNINSIEKIEITDKYETLELNELNNVTGIEIDSELADLILENLHFKKDNDKYLVPSFRKDIENDHDLIEEIIRVYGLDKIDIYDTVKTFVLKDPVISNQKAIIERELEQTILKCNMNQVITYSLISEKNASLFDNDVQNLVKLLMPQSNEREFYRGSLLSSLIEVHNYNSARKNSNSNIFEIANTYYYDEQHEIKEKNLISALVSGIKDSYLTDNVSYDFFDLKAVCDEVAKFFNTNFNYIELELDNNYPEFNKYAAACIYEDEKFIGVIGELHPSLINDRAYVFELDITDLLLRESSITKYNRLFATPNISRDLTFDLTLDTSIGETSFLFEDSEFIVSYNVKDIYLHENDTKSITFNIEFNSLSSDLTTKIIDEELNKIINKAIEANYGFKK